MWLGRVAALVKSAKEARAYECDSKKVEVSRLHKRPDFTSPATTPAGAPRDRGGSGRPGRKSHCVAALPLGILAAPSPAQREPVGQFSRHDTPNPKARHSAKIELFLRQPVFGMPLSGVANILRWPTRQLRQPDPTCASQPHGLSLQRSNQFLVSLTAAAGHC